MQLVKTLRFILQHPFGRERPLTALSRYARWQLSSRTGLGCTVVPFVEDSVLIVAHGMTGATGNVYVGLHECDDMGFILHFLRGGDLFLDVGSNVGSYSVLAASAAGSACVAIEPLPATFRRLVDNLMINRIADQVEAHCAAVGATRGVLRFSADLDTMNHVVDEHYAGTQVEVPVLPLDEIVGDRAPIAMKIDVEGFEHEVLTGAAGVLANSSLKAVLMEASDLRGSYARAAQSPTEILEQAGFEPHRYDARARKLRRCDSDLRSEHGNTLYLRDADFVRERVSTARTFRVGPWRI